MQTVTLDTLGNGALSELFGLELAKVIANIADINTPEKKKRSIDIKVSFTPKDRERVEIALSCSSKLAPIATVESQMFVGMVKGRLVAVEHDPKQGGFFDEERKPQLAAVAQFGKDVE